MSIFRAMEEFNGLPKLGMSATALGIRVGKDIDTDGHGAVHRPRFDANEANGLSCAPTAGDLPRFVRPISHGGIDRKTRVWMIHLDDLGPDLTAQEDSAPGNVRHISIGPERTMSFNDYCRAIELTRSKWRIV
jgi:hypothetical protein